MYLPADLSRYSKPPANQFQNILNGSILPIQATDPNCMYKLDEEQFGFDHLDGTFSPDLGIRINRTPLLPTDPSTYASLSKFVEQNLRKYHTTMGNINQNQLTNPLTLPPETIGVQPDGKTEVLPIGCGINPLISDPFKNVHLIPGCIATIVNFQSLTKNGGFPIHPATSSISSIGLDNSNGAGGKLWTRNKTLKSEAVPPRSSPKNLDSLKPPKSNLSRTTSTFISRVLTADNFAKKYNNATNFLLGCHGRVFSLIVLNANPAEMEVDTPLFKLNVTIGIITAVACFHYTTSLNEKNMDILIGYSTGDILWVNPGKMKYSRWNKNSKLKSKPISCIEWSKCGTYAIVGFVDGEVLFFHRDCEDEEDYKKHGEAIKKERYLKAFGSPNTTKSIANPISHFKFSNKAITSVKVHPLYSNILVISCDDGYIRVFDMLMETITDLMPSYYGGILCLDVTNDGKYLISGGEDDFVSVYEFQFSQAINSNPEMGLLKLVTRLQGSRSWVRAVKIDYFKTTNGLLYRIGAVGDDGCLRFYEFQPRNLPKIKKLKSKTTARPTFDKRFSSLTVDSGGNSMNRQMSTKGLSVEMAAASSKKRFFTPNHQPNSESISSLTSSTTHLQQQQQRPSLYEIINKDSRASSSQQLANMSTNDSETVTQDPFLNLNIITKTMADCLRFGDLFPQPVIHKSVGLKDTPVLYPIGEKDVCLGRMSGLFFESKYVWAFISTGDLIRWKRP